LCSGKWKTPAENRLGHVAHSRGISTADKHVKERTRTLRAEAYLKKPVKLERLLEVVALFTTGAA
jgi:hypothetical protein